MSDQQVKQQFWSIERFVAFVLAPVVTPLSGAFALWLSKHFPGVHVTGAAVYAFAATTAGGVAASFIKWLDGRQKFLSSVSAVEGSVGSLLKPVEAVIPPQERASLLQEIERIVSGYMMKLASRITPPSAATDVAVDVPDPEDDPWASPAANDPAPGGGEPPGDQPASAPAPAAGGAASIQGS